MAEENSGTNGYVTRTQQNAIETKKVEVLGKMKNPFPYSFKYILTCYLLNGVALLAVVYVATTFGFNVSYGLEGRM